MLTSYINLKCQVLEQPFFFSYVNYCKSVILFFLKITILNFQKSNDFLLKKKHDFQYKIFIFDSLTSVSNLELLLRFVLNLDL